MSNLLKTNLIIGGSTGDFYRVTDAVNTDALVSEFFALAETNAIEIMFHGTENIQHTMSHEILKHNFAHYSIHAPTHGYQDNESSHKILKELKNICSILPISNIVIHPDTVVDRSVFQQYPGLPFSVENMDERKNFGRTVEDIGKILKENPDFGFTLDLQHCFANDPTMKLADDFHTAFGDRIVQYHISGYESKYPHYLLFKTQQNQIIKALQKKDIPIVIESTFDKKSDLKEEIEYIIHRLKK